MTPYSPALAEEPADESLRYAARAIDKALSSWDTEVALMQLGKQGKLAAAAQLLSESALQQLSMGTSDGRAAASEYTKHTNSMLTYLFLASAPPQRHAPGLLLCGLLWSCAPISPLPPLT